MAVANRHHAVWSLTTKRALVNFIIQVVIGIVGVFLVVLMSDFWAPILLRMLCEEER